MAKRVVDRLYTNDPFSQWLGIKRIKEDKGLCILSMTIKQEMLNGFGIAHGGITYSLADSALAFASNSHGKQAVSIETSISHLSRCAVGDVLTATAREVHRSNKLGVYHVTITNQKEEQVAHFKGTVYRTEKDWF